MLIPSKIKSRRFRLDHTVVRERLLAKLSGAGNFRRHGNQSCWLWENHACLTVGGGQK